MFTQQQQQQLQQLQQQQQLLQIQQLLQQPPPQAPLPMAVSRGLPQQQTQQQLLSLQGTSSASVLNGPMLQRALLLQQLQGLDQFAMPPATYDSACLTMPTATLGNLRGYSLAAPSLSPPQLTTPNLQQFFPQATRQSLLGPPPVGLPMNPPQLGLSGRTPQKQARTPACTTPNRKDSSSQTVPGEDRPDPPEGSEEAAAPPEDVPEDQDSAPCPDAVSREKHTLPPEPEPEPEPCELSEPPAKRSKSSEEPAEPGPTGQLKVKVQPQARMTAPKQTQTPELLPEPVEARVLPRFQPRVLQVQAQVQPQTQPRMPPADPRVQPKLQKQAQTQTSPEHLVPRQEQVQPGRLQEAEPQKQVLPQAQPRLQPQEQPQEQLPERTQPHVSRPAAEQAPVPVHATAPETPSDTGEAAGDVGELLPEPAGAQDEGEESGEEPARGLDVGECERRAREMLGTWGAGGSLKVTILQSSDSRAFSTAPLPPGPRPSGDASRAPAAASPPSKPGLQFFCYICKASCSSQQEFQDHMLGAQHQQRLGEIQHMSQACLLSLLPVPRDVLEREEEPPPRRWCNTCQVYYVGDLIQHRRTQDHKLKMLEKEVAGQDEDHFITVDAVGCFEGDEEEEDDEDDDEEEIEVEEEFCKQVRSRDISIEEWKGSETYNPNTAYGVDFLVPVMGYVCRICRKFYHSNSGVQLSHCKSLAHFENLQKYKAAKNPSPTSRPVSRRCAINARNALTALFTTGGRSPIQPSTQDTAKSASKVTAQLPKPPPRRSTRLKS